MREFTIKIADLLVSIESKYDYSYQKCIDYIDKSETKPDFKLFLDDIKSDEMLIEDSSPEFKESIAIYDAISRNLPKYNAFMIHGASIMYRNNGYLFIAPSGVGKSTHINMWRKHLNDLKIINGDKPIVRLIDNKPHIFGSPWNGKENLGSNINAPLKAIVILKRSNTNSIKKVEKKKYLNDVLKQIYIPNINLLEEITLVDKVFNLVELYELNCTKDDEAFLVSYKGLIGEEYEDK